MKNSLNRIGNLSPYFLGSFFIFILPWFFAPAKRVISDSYNMGFNNAVAILGVGATLLLLILVRIFAARRINDSESTRESSAVEFSRSLDFSNAGRFSKPDLGLLFMYCLVAIVSISFWWFLLPNHNYGEMKSFIPCSELILLGRKPYTQFQFNYGPIFLYLPVAFVWLFGGAVGVDTGYFLSFLLLTVTGLCSLAYCVTIFPVAARFRIFTFVSLPFLFNVFGMGMNYTAMRFAMPYAMLIFLHNCAARFFAHDQTTNSSEKLLAATLRLGLAFSGSVVLCFSISPETGLAFLLGATVFLAFCLRAQPRRLQAHLIASAISGITAAAAFLLIVSKEYFLSIWSFGSGGYNFPIFPSPYILFYLGNLAVAVPCLAVFGLRHIGSHAALALSWACMATLFAAPALGRCDPSHVLTNGLGAFLGCAFVLYPAAMQSPANTTPANTASVNTASLRASSLEESWLQPSFIRARKFYFALFGLCYIGLPIWGLIHLDNILVNKALESRAKGQRKVNRIFWKPELPQEKAVTADFDKNFRAYPKIGTPLGCPEALEIYLKRSGKFVPEFYTAPAYGAFTEDQVQQKVEEIRGMPVILVPKKLARLTFTNSQKANYARHEAVFMSQLLLFPITYQLRHDPLIPHVEWAAFIRRNFRVQRKIGDELLMVRRSPVAAL